MPIAVILAVAFALAAHAQPAATPDPPGASGDHGARGSRIAVRLCGPIILVPARVNQSDTLWFQLDTGFENSVIDPTRVEPLGLTAGARQTVPAPGGSVERATVTGAVLRLGDLRVEDQVFSAIDIAALGKFFGHRVDGILGFDFLSRHVVSIDYERQYITLYEPGSFQYAGRGVVIPVDLATRQPYVRACVRPRGRSPVCGRFEIDTGSMDALTLNTPFAEDHKIPGPGEKTFSVRGRSLGGETTGQLTRVEGLELDGIRISTPITGIVADDVDRAGQISGEVLRRFKVIFDYSRSVMILEKTARSNDPFEIDMAGMFVIAAGEHLERREVFLVMADSPAERSGLRAGDLLTVIDGRPAGSMSLEEIRHRFKRDGQRRTIVFRRGSRTMKATLTLRRLL